MKKTTLILAFLVCFVSYQGFAGGKPEGNEEIKGEIKSINEKIGKINEELKRIKPIVSVPENQGNNSGDKISNQETTDKTPVTPKNESIQPNVSDQDNQKTEAQAAPVDIVNSNEQPDQKKDIGNDNDKSSDKGSETKRSETSSKNVMGKGSIDPQSVIAYAKNKNPALSNSDIAIINEYFKEASDEGVNVDIAIAQMLYRTNNLKQRKANHNYGGLKDCSFPDMTTGVRAHIQHLKAYAKETPKKGIVDPRFKTALDRGLSGINFGQVYSIWSENPSYGQNIEEILSSL